MTTAEVYCGDCRDVLGGLELAGDRFDACVTDPPYGLSFMGKAWDYDVPSVETWRAVLAVLKPGAHLAAFAGSRTYHRMACAIEDAGFEIRDCLMWLYGTGFPKSHNLKGDRQGWGTALKPAHEPIVFARKPLAGTVAANVAKHGTGAINIDGCRIGTDVVGWGGGAAGGNTWSDENCGLAKNGEARPVVGRWPANVLHDGSDEVVELFPAEAKAGSAARFFYCAKATSKERETGCELLPLRVADEQHKVPRDVLDDPRRAGTVPRRNHHPTVKPVELMRYLCRLITPSGGVVLDPFAGSGSTGCAAQLEGFGFVGVEREAAYWEIARARIAAAAKDAA